MRQFFAQYPVSQQRHQREREDKRANQRGRHRQGHRLKDAAFMPLQRKNRDVRGNDDEHGEQRGPADFIGRVDDHVLALVVGHGLFAFGQPVQNVFNHDDCAVHNDAEIHRPQAE